MATPPRPSGTNSASGLCNGISSLRVIPLRLASTSMLIGIVGSPNELTYKAINSRALARIAEGASTAPVERTNSSMSASVDRA